ncbi:MAG TPA: protein translocase subunit SecD [Acidimicrobiia bacterium]|nr:protein translocase subunit SecD [Acidimicrobiia bacterium]
MRRSVWFLVGTLVVVIGTFLATLLSGNTPVLGLDLQGGISVVLAPVGKTTNDTLNTAVNIIRNRVDSLGVAEPQITRTGKTIVVDLPGVKDRAQAQRLVGRTAELRFRPVLNETAAPTKSSSKPKSTTSTTKPGTTSTTKPATTSTTKKQSMGATLPPIRLTAATPTTTPSTAATTTTTAPAQSALPPITPLDQDKANATVVLPGRHIKGQPDIIYELGPAALTGKGVSSAQASYQQGGDGWGVDVKLNSKGLDAFNGMAAKQYGQPAPTNQVAITLDGVVQSAPAFQTSHFDNNGVRISGSFTQSEAEDLARLLRFGALPVQLKQLTSENVSPTLGSDQLRAGLIAGVIGLALVAGYMLFYYRLLGLVVWAGIALSGMALYTLVTYLGNSVNLTLSLAGVTGIIVSVGVTVDSYVVYFERLKDEVRSGKTIRSSLDHGFTRAFKTIVAADLVSLLSAGALYVLAVGSVRGFAFFLGLSTLLDLVIAYFFMHPVVVLLARRRNLVTGPLGIAAGLDVREATV